MNNEEEYECPECGGKITVDMTVCPNCGIEISFEYEDEEQGRIWQKKQKINQNLF